MSQDSTDPYEADLGKNAANFVPLSPIAFLLRSAAVYPNRPAVMPMGGALNCWKLFCDAYLPLNQRLVAWNI